MLHYNKKYFSYQNKIGEFGGKANIYKFKKYIKKTDKVLDFGCGGGYLLNNIDCEEKIGFDVNIHAIKYANDAFGLMVNNNIDNLKKNYFDVIISNHCIEHIKNPFETLEILKEKIKIGGKIIIYVPNDKFNYKFTNNDIDNHLFSWSPSNLGNLLKSTGYIVIKTGCSLSKWPPYYSIIQGIFGWKIFNIICKIYGFFDRRRSQSFVIATK